MAMEGLIEQLIQRTAIGIKHQERIAQLSGANFNVFRVLNLSTNETRTHSAFIAELLNPSGSHSQRTVFLEIFLLQQGIKYFDLTQVRVDIETFAGTIDQDYLSGGRLDIVISDNRGHGLIIENKIRAGDQKNQLLRYHKYGKDIFPNGFELFYLTLDGAPPTNWSIGDGPSITEPLRAIEYRSISYREDIFAWLDTSRKEAMNFPFIRESISQYMNLIKDLTGQTMNSQLTKDITSEVIENGEESIKAVFELHNSIYPSLVASLTELLSKQVEEIAKELSLEVEIDRNLGNNHAGFYFYQKAWTSISIGFAWENGGIYYGILRRQKDKDLHSEILAELRKRLISAPASNDWPWWKWMYAKESSNQALIEVTNGKFKDNIKSKVQDFVERLEGLKV